MTEDEIVGWHHRLDGHEFEHGLGVGGGHGSLACCSPWDCKKRNMTECLSLFPGCVLPSRVEQSVCPVVAG